MQRVHESLIINKDKEFECIKCGHKFCKSNQNYKEFALYRERSPRELMKQYPNPKKTIFREFYCPGCQVLLEVEAVAPDSPFIHDIEIHL